MSNFLQWAKSNPVTITCILLIVLAVGSFIWPIGGMQQQVIKDAEQTAQKKQTIERVLRGSHPLPIKPETGSADFKGPIRTADLDELQRIFEKMGSGYKQLYSNVLSINQYGLRNDQGQPLSPHRPLVDNLFPEIPDAKRFNARQQYMQGLQNLYGALRAGMPPNEAQITSELKRVEEDFKASILSVTGELMADQKRELAHRQVKAHRDMILSKARSIKLYGAPPTFFTEQAVGIFDISNLALSSASPTDWEIWEGQMNLWIQQDICTAILLTNNASRDNQPYPSVVEAPIKQITEIKVLPMYVGVPTAGLGVIGEPGAPPPPAAAQPAADTTEGFAVSPTGRQTNPLYDVRLAMVTLVIDAARINDFFDRLAQVNFITPIVNSVTQIDKEEAFKAGYYYGSDEVVALNLTLEFCWLRRWTAGHLTPEKAQQEFRNWWLDVDPTQLPDAQKQLVAEYKALSDPTQQLEMIRKEYFDRGLMPDAVRFYLGLPTLNPDYATQQATTTPGSGGPG